MTSDIPSPVTVLGLGAMGTAIARTFVAAGHRTTVWNRTGHKTDGLITQGAVRAESAADAVNAGPLVIVCLFDYASVHDVLDPIVGSLAGRVLVNVTTGCPEQAREMAGWAVDHGITYLDGA